MDVSNCVWNMEVWYCEANDVRRSVATVLPVCMKILKAAELHELKKPTPLIWGSSLINWYFRLKIKTFDETGGCKALYETLKCVTIPLMHEILFPLFLLLGSQIPPWQTSQWCGQSVRMAGCEVSSWSVEWRVLPPPRLRASSRWGHLPLAWSWWMKWKFPRRTCCPTSLVSL